MGTSYREPKQLRPSGALPTVWQPQKYPCRIIVPDKAGMFPQNGAMKRHPPMPNREAPRKRLWLTFWVILPALRHPAITPMNLQNEHFIRILRVGSQCSQVSAQGSKPVLLCSKSDWPTPRPPSSTQMPEPSANQVYLSCLRVRVLHQITSMWGQLRFSESLSGKSPAGQPVLHPKLREMPPGIKCDSVYRNRAVVSPQPNSQLVLQVLLTWTMKQYKTAAVVTLFTNASIFLCGGCSGVVLCVNCPRDLKTPIDQLVISGSSACKGSLWFFWW